MVQITTRTLHVRRIPALLLKIDISKAFDTVSWPFLLHVLRHLGFGPRFIAWICALLSMSSSRILLNGVPGRPLLHRRGLRQDDPLLPLLFILVMEVLNAMLRSADELGVLSTLQCHGIRFRISMYADNVVVFIRPIPQDFDCIRAALDCFGGASGLCTNFEKCSMSPIRCSPEHLATATLHFPCIVQPFSCTYLGLPLSYKRVPRACLQPLADKVFRKLPPSIAGMTTTVGRLVLIKSVLTSVPVYHAIAMQLPVWLLQAFDKCIRTFFWKGINTIKGGHCPVAWETMCRPIEYGGLGVLNLMTLGYAFRAR